MPRAPTLLRALSLSSKTRFRRLRKLDDNRDDPFAEDVAAEAYANRLAAAAPVLRLLTIVCTVRATTRRKGRGRVGFSQVDRETASAGTQQEQGSNALASSGIGRSGLKK